MGDDSNKETNLVEMTLELLHRQLDVLDRLWAGPQYSISIDPKAANQPKDGWVLKLLKKARVCGK